MCCFVPFISVFYAVGIWLLGTGVWSAYKSTRAGSWPTTSATISKLDLATHSDDEGNSYEVKVHYSYSVDGVAYEGSQLAFGYCASSGKSVHEQIYHRLREGKSVDVRFNPSHPEVSCLSFGLHRSIQLQLATGVTWLCFTIGFTLIFWLFSRPDQVLLNNLSVQ